MIDPNAAIVACRFLHDASLMLVWGSSAYLAWLVPDGLAEGIWWRLRMADVVAIAVAIATTLLALPIEAALIGEGWADAVDPGMLHDVLFDTTVGQAWMIQAVGAGLLLAALAFPGSKHRTSIAITSGLFLTSVALTGHAVMQDGWLGFAHIANDMVHVLSAGAWLGAMVPLSLILAKPDPANRTDVSLALRRFSNVGHVAVALVIASGVVNMQLILGHLPLEWSSAYQTLLATKIAVVTVMTGLAVLNRYGLLPLMMHRGSGVLAAIRLATFCEILLGLSAIGLVSALGMLEPV